jgi:hypothetical protein
MAIDPRIAMGGVSPSYDAFGAFNTSRAAAQTARANQMAMQAAEATATAQRNAMLEAQTLDPNNQAALRAYALRNPAAAEQVLGGLASADNLFSARGTEARAQGKFETEQRDSLQGFMRDALASIRNNPSDENIAAVSAQAVGMGIPQAQMDAYAGRFRAVPVEQRGALLDNELATTEGGRALLKTFTRDITMDDVGGSLLPRDTNLLAPGAVMPTARVKTPDPTDFEDISTPDGITRVYADGRSEILRGPSGDPLTPAPTDADERRQERREERAAAAERAASDAVSKANIALDTIDLALDSTNWATAGLAGAFEWVPGSPPKRLAGYLNTIRSNVAFNELQQMRRNSPTGGALGNVSDADMRLLQSTLATLDQLASAEDLRRALATIKRVTEAVRDAYAQDVRDFGVEAMGGSAPAPAASDRAALLAEARRRGLDVE